LGLQVFFDDSGAAAAEYSLKDTRRSFPHGRAIMKDSIAI